MTSSGLNTTESELKINPNPATDFITIDFSGMNSENLTLKIYNLLGALVYSETKVTSGAKTIDIRKLKSGIYFLKTKNLNESFTTKIIIK